MFMPPPPLGAGGIMFSGYLSIHPSMHACVIVSVQNLVIMTSSKCMNGFLSNLTEG